MEMLQPNEQHVWRTIPLKFLPVNDLHYTTKWAQDTYCYRYLFKDKTTSESYRSDVEVEDWRLQALQIMKEIKHIGIAYGRNEIVQLARDHYCMTMPQAGNYKPTNIDDVMSIITDEDWYMTNKTLKQNIIYHLMYGLTRSGMNGWLVEQERKWMQENRLQYAKDTVGIRKTRLRGFVYSIMNCQFSNSTIKLFHNVMRRKYGEYITVRKPSRMSSSNISYMQRNFLGGNGYIVTFKDRDDLIDKADLDQVDTVGLKWINLCKEDNLTLLEIHEMVDEMYNDTSSYHNDTSNDATITVPEEHDEPHYVTPSKTVRKQPQINFLERNIIREESQSGKSIINDCINIAIFVLCVKRLTVGFIFCLYYIIKLTLLHQYLAMMIAILPVLYNRLQLRFA